MPSIPKPLRAFVAVFVTVLLLGPGASAQSQRAGRDSGTSTAPPAGDPVVHSWSLTPGDGTKDAGQRSEFSYDLAPGTEASDVATLFNYSNVPLSFFIYSTDAFNNADGGFDLLPFDKKPKDVGTWFDLPEGTGVTVQPRTQVTFPFTIHVPVDARPGDHAGALLASSAVVGRSADGGTVSVDRRTGSRVYVRVAGPLEPKLTVEKVHTTYHPGVSPLGGTADVTYRIANRGNVRLAGSHRVSVGGPFGLLEKKTAAMTLSELLPGEDVTFSAKLSNVSATVLSFAKVHLDPSPIGDDEDELGGIEGSAITFALPLTVLAGLLVLALGLYARRSYRRHRDTAPATARPLILGRDRS